MPESEIVRALKSLEYSPDPEREAKYNRERGEALAAELAEGERKYRAAKAGETTNGQ